MSSLLPVTPASLLWRVPLLAACYLLAARAGFSLDLAPGFASSIWPAAGVGAAALLVWGARLWPGVFVGSYAFNWWLTGVLAVDAPPDWLHRELVASGIGASATLQAVLSAALGRPLLASGGVLRSVRRAVPFLLFTGPAACLLSASSGIFVRWVGSGLPADELFANWFTWWLGDSIGVLTFVPLTLLALPDAKTRRWRLALRVALPLAAVLALIVLSHRATQESRRQATSRSMAAVQDELRFHTSRPTERLATIGRWLTTSADATSLQFDRLRESAPEFSSFAWVPRDAPPGRALSARTLERARDTGAPAVGVPFRPASPVDEPAVALAVPVYDIEGLDASGTDHLTVDARQSRLRGYVTGVVPIDGLTAELAQEADTLELAVRLNDVSLDAPPVPLLSHNTPAAGSASLRVSLPVEFGGRMWVLDMAPTRPDLLPGASPEGRLLLSAAVVLMFLTGLFVVTEAGLGVAVAAEVTHRTAELNSEVVVRRRLEAVARENEARLDLALRGSRLALWDFEVESGRVFLSEDWSDIIEHSRRSAIAPIADLAALVHPDDVDRVTAAALAAIDGRSPEYSVEHRIRTTTGRWKWIHSHGMVTERSAAGRALRMTGTNANIDERKQAQEAMAAAERRLREMTDGLPGAVYQLQWPPDAPTPTLHFVSAGVVGLIGMQREALIHDPSRLLEAIGVEDRPRLIEFLRDINARQQSQLALDVRIHRPDGRVVWTRSQASRVGSGADAVWNGYCVDITPLVEAEQGLRVARDQAEKANRAKSAFLAAMSHEIRTPMNAILGLSELLEMRATDDEHREMLGTINASSQSLLRILNDVLDISKVEAGHLSLHLVPASIPSVIRTVALTFSESARRQGLTLDWSVDPLIAEAHLCDPARLRQILVNLVGNAVKFTEKGGVSLEATLAGTDTHGQRLDIVVHDTGIGIAPEELPRLFQPFMQADAPNARHRGGTGLGLAISKRLVELMGGSVHLDSTPGVGTSVRVLLTLPLASGVVDDTVAASAAARRAAPPRPVSGRAQPILVVDDNAFNRSVLLKQIAALGYEGHEASDGHTALRLWRERGYALILADCQMPGMDGLAFTRAVRAEEARQLLPTHTTVVAWTANVLPEDVDACRSAGMDDVLPKPSALSTVRRVIDTWLQADRPLDDGDDSRALVLEPSSTLEPIDRAQLRLIMNGDRALEQEMLEGFRDAAIREVASLGTLLSSGTPEAISATAHRLKGLARLVAAPSLAQIAAHIEALAKQQSVDSARACAAELNREWARVLEYLDQPHDVVPRDVV